MRPALLLATALILPLAACDKSPTVTATNATTAEVREKVAAATAGEDAPMVQPGRWEGSMTMHDIQIAGATNMPPQVKEHMLKEMGTPKPFTSCVTAEDVKSQKALFTGNTNDKSCKYDHFTLAGGKVDAAMHCDHGGGAKMAMTMNGAYSADSYSMDMASQAEGPMAMSMKMSVSAKRVGACRGTPDES